MSRWMRAVLLEGSGRPVVRDVAKPTLQAGELLVAMQACGLCGSDLEKIQGEYTAAPPVIGHEAVGTVAAVGAGLSEFSEGDRVFPHHHVPCYACATCRRGSETMCADYRRYHLDPGGFAEFFRVPAWIVDHGGVLHLPPSVSFDEGAFIEPLACCLRALDRFGVQEGDAVLVAGGGPMGLLTLRLLRHRGAHPILVSEVSPFRLQFAKKGGADAVVNPLEADLPTAVGELTGGAGVDLAVVASGSPRALHQALESVRAGGRVGLLGIPPTGTALQGVETLVTQEISLLSSNAATEAETKQALELIAEGAVEVDSLVTDRVPLDAFPKALELARAAESMKILIQP